MSSSQFQSQPMSNSNLNSNSNQGQQQSQQQPQQPPIAQSRRIPNQQQWLQQKQQETAARQLFVQKLSEESLLPVYGTDGSAGLDIFSAESKTIAPGETQKFQTGIKIVVPIETYGQLYSRSSLAQKGIVVVAGTIDGDYRGEVIVCLHNQSKTEHVVDKGDRIAQLICNNFVRVNVVQVDTVSADTTSRGVNGFGSTGV